MIKLVATDLDDTVIDRKNFIPECNYKAFDYLYKNNIPLAVCTGKTYALSKKLCEQMHASYGVFGNGTRIVDLINNKTIYSSLITKEQILNCISIAKANNLHVHAYCDDGIITENLEYMDLRNYEMFKKGIFGKDIKFNVIPNLKDYFLQNEINIYKFVISGTTDLTPIKNLILKDNKLYINIINKIGEYKDLIISKEYSYLDIMPFGLNKGTSLNYLSKYLNIPLENILAIGDNLNDIEFLNMAGHKVAVSNSYSKLKEIADYVTVKNVSEGGFAEAVFKYIKP